MVINTVVYSSRTFLHYIHTVAHLIFGGGGIIIVPTRWAPGKSTVCEYAELSDSCVLVSGEYSMNSDKVQHPCLSSRMRSFVQRSIPQGEKRVPQVDHDAHHHSAAGEYYTPYTAKRRPDQDFTVISFDPP